MCAVGISWSGVGVLEWCWRAVLVFVCTVVVLVYFSGVSICCSGVCMCWSGVCICWSGDSEMFFIFRSFRPCFFTAQTSLH